jgi:FkbM family methyltransferase
MNPGMGTQHGDRRTWTRALREYVNRGLARHPQIYRLVQSLRPDPNPEKTLFLMIVRDRDNVIDVGANRGWFTVLFSHLVGRHGQVHSFEPVPTTYAVLSDRVTAYCVYGNVTVNRCALGDAPGTATMNIPGDDAGQASMKVHEDFGAWAEHRHVAVQVPLSTLDAYLEDKHLQSIRLIKCDIEGAERLFLRGAARAIARYVPIVHVEVCHELMRTFGDAPSDIVRDLATLGYDRWFVTGDMRPTWIDAPGALTAPDLPRYLNLTCFNTSAHRDVIERLAASRFGRRFAPKLSRQH